jgi:hypothetical protein
MSDFLSVITPNANLTVADFDAATIGPGSSTGLATGDIRRRYNFGSRVSELAIPQDPFFRFISKVAKKATDDPQFKYSEKRPSFHKRYAYPSAFSQDGGTWVEDQSSNQTTQYDDYETAGSTVYVKMVSDYLNQGNIQSKFGNTNEDVLLGHDGTQPQFFMPGQVVKIPFAVSAAGEMGSYALVRISEVVSLQDESTATPTGHAQGEAAVLKAIVVKTKDAGDDYFAGPLGVNAPVGDVTATTEISGAGGAAGSGLEASRCYVVGTAHQEGSGFPETWADQPYSSQYGVTQIWKTTMAMTNTARATVLKFEPNEWARVWKEKLIEHKWDIETSMLFGSQYEDSTNAINYTQGAVDYISQYGNIFSLTLATKTQDDFLDDLSNYVDPRYNNSQATVFFCNTAVYNWLHKLSGYFSNNLEVSANLRAEMSLTGKKKVFGVDISTISTVYGDMQVARNIHLDGTNVKMLGINMKNCAYRPLVGNGINRDTSVYVGVQTLENSGVDRRVDQILTEAGMEWSMGESHAIWT